MVALIEGVAAKCVVQELPGITQTHVIEPPKKDGANKSYSIVTEGANLGGSRLSGRGGFQAKPSTSFRGMI